MLPRNTQYNTLRDQHGVYCARCLRYKKYEKHHPITEALTKRYSLIGSWLKKGTVPACAKCHQPYLQEHSYSLNAEITNLLDPPCIDLTEEEKFAKIVGVAFHLFHNGFYRAVIFITETARRTYTSSLFQSRLGKQLLQCAIKADYSNAGYGKPVSFYSLFPQWHLDPEICAEFANNLANHGMYNDATKQLDLALNQLNSWKWSKRRDELQPMMIRRSVQCVRDIEEVKRALRDQNDNPYAMKTLLIGAGRIQHRRGLCVQATDYYSRVLSQQKAVDEIVDVSWTHVAEALFGLSCIQLNYPNLNTKKLRDVYKKLVQAQYIVGLLGNPLAYNADITFYKTLRETLSKHSQLDMFGQAIISQILSVFFPRAMFTEEECFEMRTCAILKRNSVFCAWSLQDAVFKTIRGKTIT